MRFAAYAGTSMVLATGVIIRALHERANFYSACVYLAQSNACLMVLTNIGLLGVCTGMVGLQRLFYGPLRPIEVEQLYEKAWFAITETCLAMTIFREEVGGWFLVMFVCLLIGKVWGWIGEGRVEILEQQPPTNPRLFHTRLSVSLLISILFDIFMLRYSINTVLRHARPNMMVMFAFEFAVLTVTSVSTAARYSISLHEASVIKTQIKDRRAQLTRGGESVQPPTTNSDNTSSEARAAVASAEDNVDLLDIDVPGWEEKGRWVFYLDLATDFSKLVLYLTFFCVLCMFYGMPIHIIRDVALTIRSFYKRITDFVRYRQATRDMNARYPDATAEEVAREDVCIICREEMRPWQQHPTPVQQQAENGAADATAPIAVDERLRPKKLPCGHILHFACLRSWLERQQNCPTCRRPVLVTGTVARTQEPVLADRDGRGHAHPNHPPAQVLPHGNVQQPIVAHNVFNLGPLRIAFGARQGIQGHQQPLNNGPSPAQQGQMPPAQQPRMANAVGLQLHGPEAQNRTVVDFSPTNLQLQLHQIEQHLIREINGLRVQQNQLTIVRALQGELARLRISQANPEMLLGAHPAAANQSRSVEGLSPTPQDGQSFSSSAQQQTMGHGHPHLPAGMAIPLGWTVLPLQRVPDRTNASSNEINSEGTSRAQAPARSVGPSAASLPSDAVSTATSQSVSTPISESPSMPLTGESGTVIASHQATDRPSPSSLESGGMSSPQKTVVVSSGRENARAECHIQQAYSEATSSGGMRPQSGLPDEQSSAQNPDRNEQKPNSVGSSKSVKPIEDGAASSSEGSISGSFAGSRLAKGKGKAPTVEDSTEGVD